MNHLDQIPPELAAIIPDEWKKLPTMEILAHLSGHIQTGDKYNKLAAYKPYPKQKEFHKLGATHREVMLFAGNQLGKTRAASREVAYHLTGLYPDWWEGRRFPKATEFWVASEDYELLRDVAQRELMGPPEDLGTGAIPAKMIKKVINRQGLPGAIDTVLVRHVTGGISRCKFKSYKEGRAEFQGASVEGVWFDEEPKSEDAIGIYFEALTRTNAREGLMITTFTPLRGSTAIVNRFIEDKMPGTSYVVMTIYDVTHYTDAQREAIIAQYPDHEREARTMGIPKMGIGTVFSSIDPKKIEFDIATLGIIPDHWYRICGLDFGLTHKAALLWIAHDRETDTFYVYDEYCASDELPPVHVDAWKNRGDYIPVAWPHDGKGREKGTGVQLIRRYIDNGMKALEEHAQLPESFIKSKGYRDRMSVEAGILEILLAMREGRFKIAKHLTHLWSEFRMYHRNERGKIVDRNDDCISSMRYGFVMLLSGHGAQNLKNRTMSSFFGMKRYKSARYG